MGTVLDMLRKRLPPSLKSVLVRAYRRLRRTSLYRAFFHHPRSRDALFEYWKQPWDGHNLPADYLEGRERSEFLVRLVEQYAEPTSTILELGCNVGRNLYYLFQAGFMNLAAIEISTNAVQILRETFPELDAVLTIHNGPIEAVLPTLQDNAFDVSFTMAVLEHIHTESEEVFREIVRATKRILVTVEDEEHLSWRHFPRDYQRVFELLGMEQVQALECDDIAGLGPGFVTRVFRKSSIPTIKETC